MPKRKRDAEEDHGGRTPQRPLFRRSQCSTRRTDPPLFSEARLHPDEVKRLLNKAPSPAVRAAWLEGAIIPGHFSQHRLKVIEVDERARQVDFEGLHYRPQKAPQQLFDEGQEWWAECAKRSGGR